MRPSSDPLPDTSVSTTDSASDILVLREDVIQWVRGSIFQGLVDYFIPQYQEFLSFLRPGDERPDAVRKIYGRHQIADDGMSIIKNGHPDRSKPAHHHRHFWLLAVLVSTLLDFSQPISFSSRLHTYPGLKSAFDSSIVSGQSWYEERVESFCPHVPRH